MNRTLLTLAALTLVTGLAVAQTPVGSVWGTVVDGDGNPVASAVVKFHIDISPPDTCDGSGGNGSGECDGSGDGAGDGNGNGEGGWALVEASTDALGTYTIPELPAGSGWARACKPTVGTAYQTIEIVAGTENRYDFQLSSGLGGRRPAPQTN
jgi:hypothetical protein